MSAELLHPSKDDILLFTQRIGFSLDTDSVEQIYSTYFPQERRVVRIRDAHYNSKVLKIRPDNEHGRREWKKLQLLFASYRFSGGHFPSVNLLSLPDSSYLVFDMAYLGSSLNELGTVLDLIEYGEIDSSEVLFHGFSRDNITRLLCQLENGHRAFATHHQMIHGDVLQQGAPNNIVYHPELDRLFFVDAEALAVGSEEGILRFSDQMQQVENWMCMNLLKE